MEDALKHLERGWALRPLFEAAGAAYNEQTGFYELHKAEGGLTDLTEEDMLNTFVGSMAIYNTNDWSLALYGNRTIRTNMLDGRRIAIGGVGTSDSFNIGGFASGARNLEIARVPNGCYPNDMYAAFAECFKLRRVIGIINVMKIRTLNAFRRCSELQEVRIGRLQRDISFSDSPLLSIGSILYMIKESEASSNITITLHPEAFARAVADQNIQQALQDKIFISLEQAVIKI